MEYLFKYIWIWIFLVTMIIVFILAYLDYKKKRKVNYYPNLSFLIPCYNDWESVEKAIKSVYNLYENAKIELIVINDKSTDNSFEILKKLQKIYWFKLINNEKNLWKVWTLNANISLTTNELVVLIDADVILNKNAINEIISRFQSNPRIWWVSCPYASYNKWFFPLMQNIEYNMARIIQWSYNNFSAISLWWWCLAFRREAFSQVWQFSINAITEDMDLAFKMNRAWWKIEQSFSAIKTVVPENFKEWYKQRLRWDSWRIQCFIKYIDVWIRNPLYILLVFLFSTVVVLSTYKFFVSVINFYIDLEWIKTFQWLINIFYLLDGNWFILWILTKLSFTLLSLPYVIPFIKRFQDIWKVVYVIPFSLIYIPVFSVVWLIWTVIWLYRYRKLKLGVRAR